jgi:MFS transporter, putative metabolite:H+ symporter
MPTTKPLNYRLWLTVIVSALGYLVDTFDIMIFSVVRVPSLKEIGVAESDWTAVGLAILNWQMVGMVLGGLIWGVIGDKKGRLTVLFGSIFLYSTASVLNIFVTSTEQYMILRFLAGFGLSGELGAGVTLVSELLPTRYRGYGTMLIAGIGVLGVNLAAFLGQFAHWKTCYLLGGILGFGLLLIRVSVVESGIFQKLTEKKVRRGDLLQLFGEPKLLFPYLRCLLLAVPAWMFMALVTTLAPEIGQGMGLDEPLTSAEALLYMSIGTGIGDFTCSWISQKLRSRKQALGLFLVALNALGMVFSFAVFHHAQSLLWLFLCLGICTGYWAVFLMTTAEQFGTNIRATASTSAPNFVRASIVPLSFSLQLLKPSMGIKNSIIILFVCTSALAFYSLIHMKETFADDLEFES